MKHYPLIIVLVLIFSCGFSQKKVSVDNLYKTYTFYPKSVYGLNSMKDGEHYSTLVKGRAIVQYSYKTGEATDTLVKIADFKNEKIKRISNYKFSSDESKIIFHINYERIYRRSFYADYYVYDITNKKLYPVSKKGRERLGTLSPNGETVTFVRNNNLFISDYKTGKITQVTNDGKFNEIINGAPDWVYEEEFGYNQAFTWSADGKYLAFCRFDESKVKKYTILKYKGLAPEYKKNREYPEVYSYKYPKAGEDNSIVTVKIYNTESKKTIEVKTGEDTNVYFPRILWSLKDKTLAVVKLNRHQNHMDILFANADNGNTETVYSEDNKYYIDQPPYENLTFTDKDNFIIMSELSGYNQLYSYNIPKKKLTQITKGDFDIVDFYGFDKKKQKIFYSSTEEGAIYRTVYSIKLNGSKKQKISVQKGSNNTVFSKGFKYYVNYYSNSETPTLVTLYNKKGKQIRVLEDNKALKDTLKSYEIAKKEFFTFTTSDGVKLNGWIMKPVNFDKSKQYPVIMTQYSGPGSQQVLDNFGIGWEQVLVGKGFIMACVDGRGTGGRGEAFKKITYKQLGKYETIDQIETAKYLGSLPYIDKNKIGIWGWSFGGFMSLNCMTIGADYFNTGVAVAPVTNWRYYDNIYTERFMQLPQENASGYDDNSPINHVDKLKGNLLIICGSADDNVHPQNTFEFTEALVQANKQFDMAVYTNRNHSIYGGNTRYHLFTKMVNYFVNHLK